MAISEAMSDNLPDAYGILAGSDGFQTENPSHGLKIVFGAEGVSIRDENGSREWRMTLTGVGCGTAQPVPPATMAAAGNRMEYRRGDILTEWYLNTPFGLEQGFTLSEPPGERNGGRLRLEMALGGNLNASVRDGKTLVLTDSHGNEAFQYAGLAVLDADGTELPARLSVSDRRLTIDVDDATARYPVIIDPWVQTAKLTASDGQMADAFGHSVAVSGDTIVAGADGVDVGGNSTQGAAYVFEKTGTTWSDMTETVKLTASDGSAGDQFGNSVSISGDVIVVGAFCKEVSTHPNQGAVYVFEKSGTSWAEKAKLTASGGAVDDLFGSSVSVSGDIIVIGAYQYNSSQGAAYIFEKPVTGWQTMTETATLTVPGTFRFGCSASINQGTVAVGAYSSNSAYIFEKSGTWQQVAELTVSGGATGDFGWSVAVGLDTVVVGARGVNSAKGAAYIFEKPGTGWNATLTENATLTPSDSGGSFGWSVSISGDIVVAGASQHNGMQGAVYLFQKPDTGWSGTLTEDSKLTASDGAAMDELGRSVSVSGNFVLAGAHNAASSKGAAYVFYETEAITTATPVSITAYSAVLGGEITSSGGAPVIERGVCWSTSPNPETTDSKQAMGSGSGTFSGTGTGLSPGTRYYVRAYAIEGGVPQYGRQVTFSTTAILPVVITAPVTDVTATTAECGGSVAYTEDIRVLARGVCWDTAPEPHLITDHHTDDGTDLGDFISQAGNLLPGTVYYLRAYASVEIGGLIYTVYGDEVTFTTSVVSNAGFTVDPVTGLTTTEEGGTATFTVKLNDAPTDNVTVTLSSSDESEGTVSPASLTFTPDNWSAPQTVTVTGADDDLTDGAQAYTIVLDAAVSEDGNYSGLDPADVSVSNTDDDIAGFTVTPTGIETSEDGTSATFTVRLSSAPTADVTIALSSSDETEGTVSPESLTFTPENWSTPQTVTVTGADDAEKDGGQEFTIVLAAAVSEDADYDGPDPADVAVLNNDNDAAGLTVSEVTGTASEDGDAATFTVRLVVQPSASVTLSVTSADTGEGTVSPETLTFTTEDWETPQTVTVTGADDTVADGDQIFSVSVAPQTSDDPEYAALSPVSVSVTNTDDDSAGFTVSPVSGNTTESGGTATFTVVLKTQPSAEVTVAVSSSDTGEGTVAPASLTFTTEDWETPQTVTVTGADDSDTDGSQAYSVVLAPAQSEDANYNGADPADVSVINADNDATSPQPSPEPTPDTFDFTYYFPLAAVGNPETAEIGMFNPGNSSEDGVLKAFDSTGSQIGSDVSIFLSANGTDRMNLGDLFQNARNIASLTFESDADELYGYTTYTDGNDRRAALPLILDMSEGDIHIPHIASDPAWVTRIDLVSSLNFRRSVDVGFDNGASVTLTVPAHGRVSRTIRELFAGNAQPDIGSAVINDAAGMACVLSFAGTEESENSYLGSILLTGETAEELFYPHIADDDIWWTGGVVYNASESSCDIEIVPYMSDGTAGDALPGTLGSGENIAGMPDELGLPADTAWVAIRSETEGCKLTGLQLFGTNDGMQMAGFATVGLSGTSGLFPITGDGGWTGIGMANPATENAAVTLTAYEDNDVIATEKLTLKAGQNLAALPEDIFQDDISDATHIRYSSAQEIAAFRLSGSANDMMLDALPGIPLKQILQQ